MRAIPPKIDLSFSAVMEIITNGEFSADSDKVHGRVRICFADERSTGDNRVITKTALESLIKSLPITPVVGSFDESKGDFTNHTEVNKKKYGYVPENPNATSEIFENQLYLSSDVILTSMADNIIGNPQSLEIDEDTVQGHWDIVDGKAYFFFTYAEFKALCVLGKDVRPAFDGAEFYNGKGSDFSMKLKFKASWSEQAQAIANAAYQSIAGEFWIDEIYDDCITYYSWDEDKNFRIPYSKNEDGSYSFGEKEAVRFYAVSADEEQLIDSLRAERNEFEEKLKTSEENFKNQFNSMADMLAKFDITILNEAGEQKSIEEIEVDFAQVIANLSNNEINAQKKIGEFETQLGDLQAKLEELSSAKEKFENLEKEYNNLQASTKANEFKISAFEKLEKDYITLSVSKFDSMLSDEEKEKLLQVGYADFKIMLADIMLSKNFENTDKVSSAFSHVNKTELPEWAKVVANRVNK